MTKGGCVAGWNLTGNTVSAEFDGSDEQERKELSVSQAVEIAAGALDAIPQLSVLGEVTGFRGPTPEAATATSKSRTTRRPSTASSGRAPTLSALSICATACR